MGLPNKITTLRIMLVPLFALWYLSPDHRWKVAAFLVAVLFEVTDLLDGYLARRTGQVTELGKLLDPLADSLSRFTVYLSFLVAGQASVWVVLILFARDTTVSYIRAIAGSKGLVLSARTSGKVKAVFQGAVGIIVTFLVMLRYNGWIPEDVYRSIGGDALITVLVWTVGVVTAASGLDYAINYGGRVLQTSPGDRDFHAG